MRTTLLERLKPEVKLGLKNNKIKYPETVDRIELLLSQQLFYGDLTMAQIKTMFTFSDIYTADRSSWDWQFGEDIFLMYNNVC